jgi:hypothetical protein
MDAFMLRPAYDSRKPEPTIATIRPLKNSARQAGAYLLPVGFRGPFFVGSLAGFSIV